MKMDSRASWLAFVILLCAWTPLAVHAQPANDAYPPPLDVPAAGSDAELEQAVADFWECVIVNDRSNMEELASLIERTGIERKDPYLRARGLVRRAWADIHKGNWENRTPQKLSLARELTADPPESFERRTDYLVARAETLLFHGSLKTVYGLPGKPKGEVDIRDGLALSWQTANNDLLFFAHWCAFRAEYIRHRALSGLFLVVKAEHYAKMAGNERYLSSARYMRFLAYSALSLFDSEEWDALSEDTLQNFPEDSLAWRKAKEFKAKLDDETIRKYLAVGRSPDAKLDFEFSIDVASEVVNAHLDGEVTDETLALTEVMVQRSKENNSQYSLFYSVIRKAEVLARLGKDKEFFVLANEYYPKFVEQGDFYLAHRMAYIARLRAELGEAQLQSEWRKRAISADRRLRAANIPQITTAAQIAIQQDQSTREATRLQAIHAQKQIEAEQSTRKAIQLASQNEAELQASRTTSVIWGSVALISVLLGTTATLFVRSRALASRRAELEREVEERSRAEERLRKAQQENIRHQRLNALGEMAAGVAHDVNNSLSPIGVYSSLMATEDFSKEEIRQFAQTIENCVTDATVLIKRLHPFYRKSFEGRSEVDVAEIIAQVAETARAQLGDREIEIREEAAPCPFVCSASDIREVLVNLTNNAIDAMGNTGQLTLRATLQDEQLTLEVADNGSGMDEETRTNCLDAFFSTKEEHGSGLGLATTNAVIESYRGNIEIESEPGAGTLFRISLPVASPGEQQPMQLVESQVPRECRILLVDDNHATRTSTQFMLESMGHRVTSCENASEALLRLSDEKVDLLLTDYKMPGRNGFELCQDVRKRYPVLATIIMTGFEEPGLGEVCDAILAKPVSIAGARAAIHRVHQHHDSPAPPHLTRSHRGKPR